MSWFVNWFDTEYYHALYSNRNEDEAEQFIARIIAFLNLQKDTKILDVACGKGRHSKYFAQCGMDVTGIDLSENSISYANRFSYNKLRFSTWDMRETYAENAFDVVVNLFSSFGYFEDAADDFRAINAMEKAAKKGGWLVLDFLNPEFVARHLKAREIVNRGNLQFHIQKKIEQGFVIKQIDFLADGEANSYTERVKLIKPNEFQKMFTDAGFTVLKTFGDYHLNEFSFAGSPRQIWILKK